MLNCSECDAGFGYIRKVFRIYSWNVLQWINRRFLKTYPSNYECARCEDCGRTVHDFIMPNEIWNEVMTGAPVIYLKDGVTPSKEGASGVLCYDCFSERAREKGLPSIFKCEPLHSSVTKVKK